MSNSPAYGTQEGWELGQGEGDGEQIILFSLGGGGHGRGVLARRYVVGSCGWRHQSPHAAGL